MSTKEVRSRIEAFLASPAPEVLCIRGKWGTGKTYSWQTITRDLRDKKDDAGNDAIALNEYAYVSLFGLNAIKEVKLQILQNTCVRAQIGDVTSFATLENVMSTVERGAKKAIVSGLESIFGSRTETVVSTMGLLTSSQLICIDDLERKGSGLSTSDVLGFISFLKEERKCKVALLLNDEVLKGKDKKEFAAYLEKVVDINVRFAPTPAENADIAIKGDDELSAFIRERCTILGIDNIRVIQKIERFVKLLRPLSQAYRPEVFKNAVRSLIVLAWVHHEPSSAPPMKFLKARNVYGLEKETATTEEAYWKTVLDKYRFAQVDEFAIALLEGIENGYFEEQKLAPHAHEANMTHISREAQQEYQDVWYKFHYSFAITEQELLDELYDATIKHGKYLTIENINATVLFFKRYGHHVRANEILHSWIEVRKDDPKAFDTSSVYMPGEELADEVKDELERAHAAQVPNLEADELFAARVKDGFDANVLIKMANLPVDEYYRVFKSNSGGELRDIISAVFQYARITNASINMQIVTENARQALKRIGSESRFNAHRVKGWGINVDDPENPTPTAEHRNT